MNNSVKRIVLDDFENDFENVNKLIKSRTLTIDEVTDILISTKSIGIIIDIPRYFENAPIDKIANALVEIGTPFDILKFLLKNENAPKNRLIKWFIAKSIYENNPTYFEFLKDVPGIDIDKLKEALTTINYYHLITKRMLNIIYQELDGNLKEMHTMKKEKLTKIKSLIFPIPPEEIIMLIDPITFIKPNQQLEPNKRIKKA